MSRSFRPIVAVVACVLLSNAAFAQLYGMTIDGSLYRVNPQTGRASRIARTDAIRVRSLAYDPVSDRLIAWDDTPRILYSIDPTNGATTVLHRYPSSNARANALQEIAYEADATGRLRGVRHATTLGGFGNEVTIDLVSGEIRDNGAVLLYESPSDLTWTPTHGLVVDARRRFDGVTGIFDVDGGRLADSPLGTVSLAYDPASADLFAFAHDVLYRIDPATGATTTVGPSGIPSGGSTLDNDINAMTFAVGSTTPPAMAGDTDGDGLFDDWETLGIPYTTSTGVAARYVLDVDGDRVSDADPLKKDIFVEVDAMASRAPSQTTLQRVIDAFDPPTNVLVPSPQGGAGGKPNITLHIHTDPADLALNLTNQGDYVNGVSGFDDFATDKARFFGTPAERVALDAAARLAAKRMAYRYCIFANSFSGTNNSGVAEAVGCDDFMVTLGRFSTPGGTPDEQAGTFMHELGHALGLRHGGADDLNFKPNYYSVMNYWWQYPRGIAPSPVWQLAYSTSVLPTLDENALSESAGIGANVPRALVPFRAPQTAACGGAFCVANNPTVCLNLASLGPGATVDWDADCLPTPGTVAADINDFSVFAPGTSAQALAVFGQGLTTLVGYHDWANIVYDVRGTATFAPGASAIDIGCDYTADLREAIRAIPSSSPCPIDFAAPPGVLDIADVVAFLQRFGASDASADIAEPFGQFDIADVISFLQQFGAGCP